MKKMHQTPSDFLPTIGVDNDRRLFNLNSATKQHYSNVKIDEGLSENVLGYIMPYTQTATTSKQGVDGHRTAKVNQKFF